jgi:hypothetical protein
MSSLPLLVSLLISNERNKNEQAENVDNNVTNNVEVNDHRIDIPTENSDESTQEVSEKQDEKPFSPRRSRMPIKCPHSLPATPYPLTGMTLQDA